MWIYRHCYYYVNILLWREWIKLGVSLTTKKNKCVSHAFLISWNVEFLIKKHNNFMISWKHVIILHACILFHKSWQWCSIILKVRLATPTIRDCPIQICQRARKHLWAGDWSWTLQLELNQHPWWLIFHLVFFSSFVNSHIS